MCYFSPLSGCRGGGFLHWSGGATNTQTTCLTAITIPGNPLTSFDISLVNPDRGEYYLADRSNKGVDMIDTAHLVFSRTVGTDKPFTGVVLNAAGTGVDNDLRSGWSGVAWALALCGRR